MTANDNNESYLAFLDELIDQYNNAFHHSINKKSITADYPPLTEKVKRILKLLNAKLMIESKLLSIRIFLVNPWTYKIKDLSEEKVIGSFYGKELLLSIL